MRDYLLMRFDAPLMSFGAPIVDAYNVIQDYPALSLLTGLLGNALGYDHREAEKLQHLQSRLRYAVRRDRAGRHLRDYHTVDLGQDHLVDTGWTSSGVVEKRGSGAATKGTHIRYRDYWADAVFTVALTLEPIDESPNLSALGDALKRPARPLFVGRKTCLPAAPLYLNTVAADSLTGALQVAEILPDSRRGEVGSRYPAWWPGDEAGDESQSRLFATVDERDWRNQIHGGRRLLRHGLLDLKGGGDE